VNLWRDISGAMAWFALARVLLVAAVAYAAAVLRPFDVCETGCVDGTILEVMISDVDCPRSPQPQQT
jgi:hypothetical protein